MSTKPTLSSCPLCQYSLASTAHECPHCGHQIGRVWYPHIAGWSSFVIPGAGQAYKGHSWVGLILFVVTLLGYFAFIVPGVILHAITIVDACTGKAKAGRFLR